MKNNKQLMFAISTSLPKNEAFCFANSMNGDDKYFIYKIGKNPKARDFQRREKWVAIRFPRKGEVVKGTYAVWAKKSELIPITKNGNF